MKFYYNDQLMRTSKNHNYTHAVVIEREDGTIRCYGCHKDRKGCEAEITREINSCHTGIENAQAAIKALNAGKAGYYSKYGRGKSCWIPFKECTHPTVERYEECINDRKATIDKINRTWKVVELEAR